MYDQLQSFGYGLVYKPTTKDSSCRPKGNADVLHAATVEYKHFDQTLIVAGDGDYRCLRESMAENQKLRAIIIPNHKSEPSLLKSF